MFSTKQNKEVEIWWVDAFLTTSAILIPYQGCRLTTLATLVFNSERPATYTQPYGVLTGIYRFISLEAIAVIS